MENILFVVAEKQEADYIINHYQMDVIGDNIYESLNGFKLIITGPGLCNVITSLSSSGLMKEDTNVINVGYAGSKGFDVGSVHIVKDSYCNEFPTIAKVGTSNQINISSEGDDCYTSFDFVNNTDINHSALFDMELAYICRFMHKSIYSIKIVSDNLDYEGFQDFDGTLAWYEVFDIIDNYTNYIL